MIAKEHKLRKVLRDYIQIKKIHIINFWRSLSTDIFSSNIKLNYIIYQASELSPGISR